ncbi:MAG: hypothetical protein HWE16_07835 [Gammaproteobacteria bacterium]|nr:hypothetical protein [Gammaproteobacteria bacterium]
MERDILELSFEDYLITIKDVTSFESNSKQESEDSVLEYIRDPEAKSHYSSIYNVEITGSFNRSIRLVGNGGATGVNKNSAVIIDQSLYVAIGDAVLSIALPDLTLNWAKQVDEATCFGVFLVENEESLISRGELQIKRLKLTGDVEWEFSGKDIFSEWFIIEEDIIEVADFNKDEYHLNIKTGELVKGPD